MIVRHGPLFSNFDTHIFSNRNLFKFWQAKLVLMCMELYSSNIILKVLNPLAVLTVFLFRKFAVQVSMYELKNTNKNLWNLSLYLFDLSCGGHLMHIKKLDLA